MRSLQTKSKYPFGVIAGAFDVIHPGYIYMFREAKEVCAYLIVALQENPQLDRPNKSVPILTVGQRMDILRSITFVDEIIVYFSEGDLWGILEKYNNNITIRILGADYENKDYTGASLRMPVYFCSRDHGWSTTKFKQLIHDSMETKK